MLYAEYHVTAMTKIHRRRALSAPGRVLRRYGDQVAADHIIAEADVPMGYHLLDLATILGAREKDIEKTLVKELGEYTTEAQSLVQGQPLYERRLVGVWAGYEFARRVSEILVLKKKHGVPVTKSDRIGNLAPKVPRPVFAGAGIYLHSIEAENAYRDLIRWVRSVNTKDHVFFNIRDQSKAALQEDVAETIFCRKGFAESVWRTW